MKKSVLLTFMGLLILTLVGCGKVVPDTTQYSNHLQAFQKTGNLWLDGERPNNVGLSAENALVPLTFDSEGNILKPSNKQANIDATVYVTTLPTYKSIVDELVSSDRLDQEFSQGISANNAQYIGMNDKGEAVYILDPYDTQKHSVNTNGLEDFTVQLVPANRSGYFYFKSGDIIVNGARGRCIVCGHAAIVVSNGYSSSAQIGEAMPNKGVSFTTVGTRFGGESIYVLRYKYRYALSSSLIANMKAFLLRQRGESYQITLNLNDTDRWYCSKLVYHAYRQLGITLNHTHGDGWGYITPYGIQHNNGHLLNGVN